MFTGADLDEAFQVYAEALHWAAHPSVEQLDRVAQLANDLIVSDGDKPAALFFAVGRYPRLFEGAWVDFGRLYAGVVASEQKKRLFLTRETARAWLVEIASQRVTFAEVRDRILALTLDLP